MSCPDCEFVYEMGSATPVASVCETCRPHDPVLWVGGDFIDPSLPTSDEIASLLRTLTAIKEETHD